MFSPWTQLSSIPPHKPATTAYTRIPLHLLRPTPIRLLSTKAPPPTLPHLSATSEVHQISITAKNPTHRTAIAIGHVSFSTPIPLSLIRSHSLKKGDVLAVARVAGIQAVKMTGRLIPLCHGGVGVEGCVIRVEAVDPVSDTISTATTSNGVGDSTDGDEAMRDEDERLEAATQLYRPVGEHGGVRLSVMVETTGKTGVEMEALTGVMGAALTVVDMVKSVDRGCEIGGFRVVGKKGGRSGGWGVWGGGAGREGL